MPLFYCFTKVSRGFGKSNQKISNWNFLNNKPNIKNDLFSGCPELQKNHQWGSEVDSLDKFSYPKSCQEACLIDSDCAEGNFFKIMF